MPRLRHEIYNTVDIECMSNDNACNICGAPEKQCINYNLMSKLLRL